MEGTEPLAQSLTNTVRHLEKFEKLLKQTPTANNLESQLTDSV
jgi:hypothetical protein